MCRLPQALQSAAILASIDAVLAATVSLARIADRYSEADALLMTELMPTFYDNAV